jgi:hypothetical protein
MVMNYKGVGIAYYDYIFTVHNGLYEIVHGLQKIYL